MAATDETSAGSPEGTGAEDLVPGDAGHARVQAAVIRFIADVVLYNHVVSQRLGLGASDSQFMTLLDVHGPLTPGQLARHAGMTTGTVTGVVDRLERAGLVERRRDPADRRKVIVSRRDDVVARTVYPHYRGQAARLERVVRQRSPEELGVVAAFLEDLLADGPAPS